MTRTPQQTDTRSVETAWAETLRAELPVDDRDPRAYATFVFGNPVFTMTDVGPDTAVVLVDELLDRYPPAHFFDVEGALTTEEWADLKERLVVLVGEGVDGERPGPASAFPGTDAESDEGGTTAAEGPASPDTPSGPGVDDAPTGRGFASDAPAVGDGVTTPTDLARAVDDLVRASGLDPAEARRALELVLEDLDDGGGDGDGDDAA